MTLSKRDIENRADLERLLEVFYKKVFKDDLISHFFIEVVPLNLETHIPVIADFWSRFYWMVEDTEKMLWRFI